MNDQDFIHSKFDICAICHKVTKCHILYRTQNEMIVVCGLCDAEWDVKIVVKQLDLQDLKTGNYFNYALIVILINFLHTKLI